MLSLTERIQAEAAAERELSEALLDYWPTRAGTNHTRLAAARRVCDAEKACNVRGIPLGTLAAEGLLGTLARDVRSMGALRAYERLRDIYLDDADEA